MTFDRVLPELIRVCSDNAATHDAIARYAIVRDVRGRVRVVVEQREPKSALPIDGLQLALSAALGDWFVGPVVSAATRTDLRHLAQKVLERSKNKWPTGWPRSLRNVLGGQDTPLDAGGRWTGIERTIGKEAWMTTTPPAPPWRLKKGRTPPIVTFHSFKGGVGRTTLVAIYAIRLASRKTPARVAIVDLDLEAPGVGDLFGVRTERGTLDVIVDHIATGMLNLDGASAIAQVDPSVDPHITVFPAGRIDAGYVQKLARLDFSSAEPEAGNPVGLALSAMLERMKADFDVIILDSRAGLHDIAGMSIHGLAHVDVLTFRGTTQNFAGLEQTLRTLGGRDRAGIVLVETLLPANDEALYRSRHERTRERVYEMMCEHVYDEDSLPQLGDIGEPHDVISVRRRDWLDGIDSLRGRVSDVLSDSELRQFAARVDEKCLLEAEVEPDAVDDEEEST
jgi:cellulose biosynthesis protein BcsQ